MPDADTVTPLCSADSFTEGPFSDLASQYQSSALNDVLIEATRACEDEVQRRLAPFTITETQRATGIDPDEYSDSANLPMSIQDTIGASYAQAIGANELVRHCWLDEYAPKYPDMWSYSDVSVSIIRSYGGTQQLQPGQILNGPEPDTGHLWFQLGLFLPVGSRVQITYTAGYNPVPASLVRACRFMAAYFILRELDPGSTNHDPDQLHADALLRLAPFARAD